MEREALKLHSITFTSLSLQMNWMLKGPGHAGRMMTGWKCSMQAEESCSLSHHEQLQADGMQSCFNCICYRLIFSC